MRFSITAIISALAAVASAVTPPDTSKPPAGNPIALPGLNEQVPAGKPYTITWAPTTPGKVSILLLRGPGHNIIPIATLADSIPNSGHFKWTPALSLEHDVTHYGLQIIVEGTGQYQYSTQFGIENDAQETEPEPTQPSYPTEAPESSYSSDVPEPTYSTDAPEPTYTTDAPEPTYTTDAPEPPYTSDVPETTYSSDVPEPTYTTDCPEPTYTTDALEPPYTSDVPEPSYSAEPTYQTEVPEPTYPSEIPEPTYSAQPTHTWITFSVPTPGTPTPSSTPPASYTPAPTYSGSPAPPVFTGAAGRNSAASLSGVVVAGLVALFAL